jgi:hypothetical protein
VLSQCGRSERGEPLKPMGPASGKINAGCDKSNHGETRQYTFM